jgi:hypothetical protein
MSNWLAEGLYKKGIVPFPSSVEDLVEAMSESQAKCLARAYLESQDVHLSGYLFAGFRALVKRIRLSFMPLTLLRGKYQAVASSESESQTASR